MRAEPACHIAEQRSSDWARQIDRTWPCGICQPPSPALVTGGLVVRRSELDDSHQDESSAAPEASTDLTAVETDRLVGLEQAVDRGLQTFVEVGQALAEIRERKLYRASHDTFERYCRERWGFTRQRARQFIDAAAVTTIVVKAGLPAPTHEPQARELVPLRKRPDELETAWRDTLIGANAAGRSPWAELVSAERHRGRAPRPPLIANAGSRSRAQSARRADPGGHRTCRPRRGRTLRASGNRLRATERALRTAGTAARRADRDGGTRST